MRGARAKKRRGPGASSLRAFARLLGVSLPAVQRAIADGRVTSIERTARGLKITDAAKARQEWEAHTRPRVAITAASGEAEANGHRKPPAPSALARATRREREARAKLAELDYERKAGILVPVREVELRWTAIVVAVRTKLLGLPSRAKQRLPHLSAADLAELDRLVRDALEELADAAPAEQFA